MKRILALLLVLSLLAGCSSRKPSQNANTPPENDQTSSVVPAPTEPSQPPPAPSRPAVEATGPLTLEQALPALVTATLDADTSHLRLGVTWQLEFSNLRGFADLPAANHGWIRLDEDRTTLSGLLIFPQGEPGAIEGTTLRFTANGSGVTNWTVENNTGDPIAWTQEAKNQLAQSLRDAMLTQAAPLLAVTPGFSTFTEGVFAQQNDGSFSEGYEPVLTLHSDGSCHMQVNGLSYMAEITGRWRSDPYRVELYDLSSDLLELPQGDTLAFTILSPHQLAFTPAANCTYDKGGISLGATFENALFNRQE